MTSISMLKAVILVAFLANSEALLGKCEICPANQRESWSYCGSNGPRFWGGTFPDCNGNNQSPIPISTSQAQQNENLEKLQFVNYDTPVAKSEVENNGHTIEVVPEDDVVRSISVNGDTYNLMQFHFHWGSKDSKGSEHVLDGRRYSMELHFVHMNQNDDIAVVGVFFEEQNTNNEEIQKIVNTFNTTVQYKDDVTELESPLNLANLLPSNTRFFRYDGSLTTPGCSEGVTWSVMPDIKAIGKEQMKAFYKQYTTTKEDAEKSCRMVNNFRPLQELNGRQVYLSQ